MTLTSKRLYKTQLGRFNEIRTLMLWKSLPLGVLALAGGIGMSYFSSENPQNPAEVSTLPLLVPLMVGCLGFGTYRGVTRQKQIYDSYALTITETQLTREQHNTPTVSIPVADVTSITKNRNGSFTIKGAAALDVIGVPKQMDHYEALEEELNAVHPLAILAHEPWQQRLQLPLTLLVVGLMATVFLATNKLLVGVSGVTLSGFLGWSFVQIQRNPNIDHATKKLRYVLVLVVLSVLGATIGKLLAA